MSVHLKISDRNWILETMARNLATRLDYVTYDTAHNPEADIQYYMTYSTYRGRVSPIELAYFTHLEEDPAVAERFFGAAHAVDASVCMSQIYADMLRDRGVKDVHVIPPGVDLNTFDVKLRIGIIGRTYVTGRKGEALMAKVMDIPGIEFLFTGDGWPLPGLHLKDDEMPGFYRTLDYVLVPARYEGGPMSVIEALACGVEVIAPPVGWVPELPHIPYKLNDADDLRRVLTGLVEARRAHRAAVLDRSWDRWATAHDVLFRKLLPASPKPVVAGLSSPKAKSIVIVSHGMESVARGGPSTRMPQLDAGLRSLGYNSSRGNYGSVPLKGADLYHLFNVATPKTALPAMNGLKSFGRPVVFSPIYLDNRCRVLWETDVPKVFSTPQSLTRKFAALKQLQEKARLVRSGSIRKDTTLPATYHQGVTRLLESADEVIYLSNLERTWLLDATGVTPQGYVVPNPVDTAPFRVADPALFRDTFGVQDYVLCVGRIEPRKNQLMLAAALSGTGIPLVLAGAAFDAAYLELIRAIPNLVLIETGHIDSGSDLLLSAFAGCRVFCLPSWSEGAPIAALEAGAAGCKMVLSSYSSESEYFGDRAAYVDPVDLMGLRAAIQQAYDSPFSSAERMELSEFTEENFSVERHVERTREVYETLLSRPHVPAPVRPVASAEAEGQTVYFDVTTLLNNPGRITGITRVELSLIRTISPNDDIRFIAWHADRQFYFYVDEELLDFERGPNYRLRTDLRRIDRLPENAPLLLQGNAWLGNHLYVMALEHLVRSSKLRLTLLVHDILPISKPQYFEPSQAEVLSRHLDRLAPLVSAFCVDSHATARDLEAYFSTRYGITAPFSVIRLGDELGAGRVAAKEAPVENDAEAARVAALLAGGNFVLSVGSQFRHKNRDLVLRVWNRLVADLGAKAPTLVIVGKVGADQSQQILEPAAQSKVVTLQGLSDDHLDQLYQNCLFTVFPSLCEGWGLPVTESLVHGKICIASDASSMREIAPDSTDLIDPFDTMAWYREIRSYATSAERRRLREAEIAKRFKLTPWRDTLESLVSIARKAQGNGPDAFVWDFEQRFDRANHDHCSRLAFTVHDSAMGGAASTKFQFGLTSFSDEPIQLHILCGSSATGQVEVLLNGVVIDTLVLDRDPEIVHSITLPGQAGTTLLALEFREVGRVGFELSQFVLSRPGSGLLSLPKQVSLVPVQYPPGEQIAISRKNDRIRRLLTDGWYGPEERACWTGKRARLHLPLGNLSGGPLQVSLKYTQLSEGPVFVSIGDFFETILDKNSQRIEVPSWVVARLGSYLDIGFTIPNATSPEALGMGPDKRILGLYLASISYAELPYIPVASAQGDTESGPAFATMLGAGWYQIEPTCVWSTGAAKLKLQVPAEAQKQLVLEMATIIDQILHVFANGQYVVSIDLTAHQPTKVPLTEIGKGGADGFVDLTLVSSLVASPAELGINSDGRRLGICLTDVAWIDSGATTIASLEPAHTGKASTKKKRNRYKLAAYHQRAKIGLRALLGRSKD